MSEVDGAGSYPIVVGLDFSDLGNRAVLEAIDLARNHSTADLHVVVVGTGTPEWITLPGDREALAEVKAREESRRRVAVLIDRYAAERGAVPLEKVAVYTLEGNPAQQIVAIAAFVDADTIVVGTHGRTGAKRLLLGSVAEEVVRLAPCNVVVVRPRDFFGGEKVPDVQAPLPPGAPHPRPLHHRRVIHHVNRLSGVPTRIMPVQ